MFDETIRYNSDWECFVRMARIGTFVYVGRPLLAYRLSESQLSSSRGNRGKGALGVVHVSEKIWRSDPSLMFTDRDRVRSCRRAFYANAARALAEHERLQAVKMLAGSIWYGAIGWETMTTAIKLILPHRLIALARRVRSSLGSR